jgi:hypothetical protein
VNGGPPAAISLTVDQQFKGGFGLFSSPVPAPAGFMGTSRSSVLVILLTLILLLGTTPRWRSARWLTLFLFLAALGALSAATGCGSSGPPGLTPGTYAYTVRATDINTNVSVSAIANVTVP